MELLDRLPTDLQEHVKGYVLLPTKACERWAQTADVAIRHFGLDKEYRRMIMDRDLHIQQRLCRMGVEVVPEQRMCIEVLKCAFVNLSNYWTYPTPSRVRYVQGMQHM